MPLLLDEPAADTLLVVWKVHVCPVSRLRRAVAGSEDSGMSRGPGNYYLVAKILSRDLLVNVRRTRLGD